MNVVILEEVRSKNGYVHSRKVCEHEVNYGGVDYITAAVTLNKVLY